MRLALELDLRIVGEASDGETTLALASTLDPVRGARATNPGTAVCLAYYRRIGVMLLHRCFPRQFRGPGSTTHAPILWRSKTCVIMDRIHWLMLIGGTRLVPPMSMSQSKASAWTDTPINVRRLSRQRPPARSRPFQYRSGCTGRRACRIGPRCSRPTPSHEHREYCRATTGRAMPRRVR